MGPNGVVISNTPLRYAWDLDSYLAGSSYPPMTRAAARAIRPVLLAWDRRTASRPDVLVAVSENVRSRIRERWGRTAELIYPPVDVGEFTVSEEDD